MKVLISKISLMGEGRERGGVREIKHEIRDSDFYMTAMTKGRWNVTDRVKPKPVSGTELIDVTLMKRNKRPRPVWLSG